MPHSTSGFLKALTKKLVDYWVKETSIYTSSGIFKRISCLMALSSAPTSITRLWIRISYLSYVLVPWPAGDFLVTTLSFFVGSGCGPRNLIPVFSPIPLISLQTPSSVVRLVLVSLILAACGISIVHFLLFVWIVLFSNAQHD